MGHRLKAKGGNMLLIPEHLSQDSPHNAMDQPPEQYFDADGEACSIGEPVSEDFFDPETHCNETLQPLVAARHIKRASARAFRQVLFDEIPRAECARSATSSCGPRGIVLGGVLVNLSQPYIYEMFH